MSDATEELMRLEHARCEAISSSDLDTLADLLADDLTHTHVSGRTDDKASYLASLAGHPRTTTRGDDVRVRFCGDVAVMTGTQRNIMAPSEPEGEPVVMDVHVLQVWVKAESGYKQLAFASSGQAPGASK